MFGATKTLNSRFGEGQILLLRRPPIRRLHRNKCDRCKDLILKRLAKAVCIYRAAWQRRAVTPKRSCGKERRWHVRVSFKQGGVRGSRCVMRLVEDDEVEQGGTRSCHSSLGG